MSGGSYNYLCFQDFPDICYRIGDMEDMANRLRELGFADAAKETDNLRLDILAMQTRLDVGTERLGMIWKTVEWYDSNDSGVENIEKAIRAYRYGKPLSPHRYISSYPDNDQGD